MKKFLKVTYPLLCAVIPFVVYGLLDGKSLVIPIVIASTMFGASMYLYDNKILAWFSTIVLLIPPVGMLFFPFYYSYILSGWWCLILPGWLLMTYMIRCMTKMLIKGGKSFNGIILTRKLLIVSLVIMAVLFILPGLYSIIDSQDWSGHHYTVDENIVGLLGSAGWVLLVGIEIYKSMRRVYLFSNYYKPYYFLFLRRFIKDDQPQVKKCLDALIHNRAGYDVMKIGDPQTLFSHSNLYDTVYLTSTDWQTHLRKHIGCAKLVFSVIDTSEGVIWEMIENTDYLDKYIYCMSDWEHVDDVKKKLNEHPTLDGVLNHKFQYFLGSLQGQGIKDMVLFTFDNGKVVYTGNLDAMIDYKLTTKWSEDLREMEV